MPNIQIILVRFNLDREDDRRLFELLQKRSMPRKRNEFLKKVLLKGMMEEAGGKSVVRPTKKQSKLALQAETTGTGQHVQKIALTSQADTPASEPLSDEPSLLPASDRAANTAGLDPEVAELIGSIVQ